MNGGGLTPESRDLVAELARQFSTQNAITALLFKADLSFEKLVPAGGSADAEQIWLLVWRRLSQTEQNNLLRAAADSAPGNELFARHREPGMQPDRRGTDPAREGQIAIKLPKGTSPELLMRVLRQAAKLVKDTGKDLSLNVGNQGCFRVQWTVKDANPEEVNRIVDAIRRMCEEQGVKADVMHEPYNFRDYFMDPLFAQGPDQRRFALDRVPASTRVKEVARAIMSHYDEKVFQTRQHAVVDHVRPDGAAVRLDPRTTLHDAGIRPGELLRVAPERTAGVVNEFTRDEALRVALGQVREHADANPDFGVTANSEDAPTIYWFTFTAPGFAPPPVAGGEPLRISSHEVKVELSNDFPFEPPRAFWQTPIFHPNIEPKTGEACLGKFQKYWRPGADFAEICRMLVEFASYRNYVVTEFVNQDAQRWACSEHGQLAIMMLGGTSLAERTALEGLETDDRLAPIIGVRGLDW